ncbi:nucleotide kinase [Klebsiella phage Whistle]|uniref:Nucleotide kinase n=1 Tax=Klebsiella phage Whistle TaxID=3018531 RepID=A0AAF0D7R2_9CAUD|nr:nucleotide kinase [Klebsiella phage Whistle]
MNKSKPCITLHASHCRSVRSFMSCDCGAKPEPVKRQVGDDGVKSPSHYQLFEGVEAIEVIARSMTQEMFRGYCLGNILKYRLRAGKKSELATLEKDMAKATFYLELYTKHKGLCYDAK